MEDKKHLNLEITQEDIVRSRVINAKRTVNGCCKKMHGNLEYKGKLIRGKPPKGKFNPKPTHPYGKGAILIGFGLLFFILLYHLHKYLKFGRLIGVPADLLKYAFSFIHLYLSILFSFCIGKLFFRIYWCPVCLHAEELFYWEKKGKYFDIFD